MFKSYRSKSLNAIARMILNILLLVLTISSIKLSSVWASEIYVPDDFPTIQSAINAANDGDTIYVNAGIYNEDIKFTVDQHGDKHDIKLIGESSLTTVINGSVLGAFPWGGITLKNFEVHGDISFLSSDFIMNRIRIVNNMVRGHVELEVQFSEISSNIIEGGLSLTHGYHAKAQHNVIENNTILSGGIVLNSGCKSNLIHDNRIINASIGILERGVWDSYPSLDNKLKGNQLINCETGICISEYSVVLPMPSRAIITQNTIEMSEHAIIIDGASNISLYMNNFESNSIQLHATNYSQIHWDNDCIGNYWSDYNGTDVNDDGVGDLPYQVDEQNIDNHPLMNQFWNIGDIDYNLVVDMVDILTIVKAYGSTPSNPEWNCHSDVMEPHGVIDIFDAVLVASYYGEVYADSKEHLESSLLQTRLS